MFRRRKRVERSRSNTTGKRLLFCCCRVHAKSSTEWKGSRLEGSPAGVEAVLIEWLDGLAEDKPETNCIKIRGACLNRLCTKAVLGL